MKKEDCKNWLTQVFSFTKMSTWSKCPRLFYNRYVLRLKMPPGEYMIFGRAAHDSMEHDALEKVKGRRAPLAELLEKGADTYSREKGQSLDGFVREHAKQLEMFESRGIRDSIYPVEGKIEGVYQIVFHISADPDEEEKEPILVEGYVDVVSQRSEGEPAVTIDYKSCARPKNDKEATEDPQLLLNALGSETELRQFVSLVREGRQRAGAKATKLVRATPEQVDRLLTFVADTANGIRRADKTGDFPKCSPGCWWCGPTECEFYHTHCYPNEPALTEKFISIGEVRPTGKCTADTSWRKKK